MKMKERKREEAERRAVERSKRTVSRQLARLDAGGFVATRERAALAKAIAKQGAA
jgi:hypothetical protein